MILVPFFHIPAGFQHRKNGFKPSIHTLRCPCLVSHSRKFAFYLSTEEWCKLSVFCRVIKASREFGNTLQLSLRRFSVAPKLQSSRPAWKKVFEIYPMSRNLRVFKLSKALRAYAANWTIQPNLSIKNVRFNLT